MTANNIKKNFNQLRGYRFIHLFQLFTRNIINKVQYRYLNAIYQLKYGSSTAKPEKIFWINPHRIEYKLIPFFHNWAPNENLTYYVEGDWDKNTGESGKTYPHEYDRIPNKQTLVRIEDLDWYQSFNSHFNEGVSWEATKLYNRRVKEGFNTNRYNSEEGLQERLNDIEQLYRSIESNGYKTQTALAQEDGTPIEASDWTHEVQVNIGRSGEFILDDGRNRLILAQILDVPKIPVRVLVRHKQWQEIRKDIHNNGFSEKYEEFRDHPDLQDVIS